MEKKIIVQNGVPLEVAKDFEPTDQPLRQVKPKESKAKKPKKK